MHRYLILLLIFLGLCVKITNGQILLVRNNDIEVYRGGAAMENPWAGGLNSPQFSAIDMNYDGRKDLVAFERNFYGYQRVFLNQGLEEEIIYRHAPVYQDAFPHLRNWMLLRDYNCDGREDIFTSVPGGIAIYRNDLIASAGMKFSLVTPLLFTIGLDGLIPLYVAPPDIPSITDIDNDGDLDILAFNVIGSTLEYHKNLSMEKFGNCDQLDFELRNACWGYFSEDGNNNTVTLFDTCEVNVDNPESANLHAGSTVLALDLTGEGVKDLLMGDITYNNLVQLTNGGTLTGAIMVEQSTTFPENSVPVDLTVFPAAYHIDVDNNDLMDLIIAPNNPNTSENFNNTWLYLNHGSGSIPEFQFEMNDFLHNGMIDLGEGSYPAFFDVNADGLLDIIAGNKGYFVGAGQYESRLFLLTNTGNNNSPEFEYTTDDYAGLSAFGFYGIYPTFGDMDGDGDGDMIIGDEDGRLHFFTNTAEVGEQAVFELSDPNYFNIDAGQSAKPQIYDLNADGLPDLLVGERSGTIKYYENTGSTNNPGFSSLPTTEELGGIDVMKECCTGYSATFMTTDSLGQTIFYVGSEQGYLYLYDNIDGNLNGTFNLVDSLYLHGTHINVNGADINQDGSQDFIYGEFAGGLGMLEYGIPPVFSIPAREARSIEFEIYPNPALSSINLRISDHSDAFSVRQIYITDILGRSLQSNSFTGNYTICDLSKLQSGIYFVILESEGSRKTKMFVKR